MQHDETAVLQRLVQHLLGAAPRHGPAVQRVAQHGAPDLRQSGDPGLVHHLVHRHRVADKRRDLQPLGQLERQHAPQVGGVGRVLHGVHIVHHGLIHQIRAGLAGRQLSATGADTVQRGQVKAVGGQRLLNGGLAEVHLLHDPVERGQLLAGVALRLIKELPLPLEHGDLRGGRAGVDDQYPFAHSVYAPDGPLRLLLSVSKNLVKPARLCYHFFKVSPAGRRRDCPLGRMWASAPTHGFSVVVSVGGDALIAPPFSHHIPGGQSRPPLHTF